MLLIGTNKGTAALESLPRNWWRGDQVHGGTQNKAQTCSLSTRWTL